MNTFECEVYMFGCNHTIFIHTDHTLQELRADWSLKEQLVTARVIEEINVQDHLEQL